MAGSIVAVFLRRQLVVNFHGEDISVLQRYNAERLALKWIIPGLIRDYYALSDSVATPAASGGAWSCVATP